MLIMFFVVKFDPLDHGLIINEQALNLTSNFSNRYRDTVSVNEFWEEFKSRKMQEFERKDGQAGKYDLTF